MTAPTAPHSSTIPRNRLPATLQDLDDFTIPEAALTEFRNSLLSGLYTVNVKDFGAVGDGVTDDRAAIIAALDHLHARGGGTLYFPPGTYLVSGGIGKIVGEYANITIKCDSHGSARILSSGNFTPLLGAWYRCNIKNVYLDAGLQGAPAINIHMAETVVRKCILDGWSGHGARLNDGTYGDVGLLNMFTENHIVQRTGEGIFQTYRWVDSWIKDNNVGSTGANLSLEGGPVRVSGNHFNGSPDVNILLRGNKRITITDNICEGAGKEAIVYEMPPWLTSDDAQVIIANNNISNGGKLAPGTYQAIRLQGVPATTGLSGFSIFGNIIACEDAGSGWSHAVGLHNTKDVTLLANVWEKGYTVSPITLSNGSPSPRAIGNSSGNRMPVTDISTTNAPGATLFLRGDGQWILPTNTTYSVMAEAEITAGTATTARTMSAVNLKSAIQRWATGAYTTAISTIGQALNRATTQLEARGAIGAAADSDFQPVSTRVAAAPATWYWAGTSLPTSAASVHAEARVGDFIVAPNLTTDPGWHRITGV